MSCLLADTRLDAIVREAVANYGQYTGEVVGHGHGRVDRVLELPAVPLDGFKHAYTRQPMISAYKIHEGTQVRHFVYVVPIEVRGGREQRMLVGRDGEDLDIATFFRPIGVDAPTGDVFVAMPSQAFAGAGDEVQYAFRVRNYVRLSGDALALIDDLLIGMEFTTSTQRKHSARGVMLVNNGQTFSFQLGELGDKQSGFRMRYVEQAESTTADAAEHAKAVLHTQLFGFVAAPPTPEEIMARAVQRHFHFDARRLQRPVTRGQTRGGSSLSHAKLVAGEAKDWRVSQSPAVPIAERAQVELRMMVGDVSRTFHEKHVEAAVAGASAAVALSQGVGVECRFDGFVESMRCLARMVRDCCEAAHKTQLQQLSDDMCCWPVSGGTDTAALGVGVIQCADEHDEDGVGLQMSSGNLGQRLYQVEEGPILRVRATNFSLRGESIELQPVYYKALSGAGHAEEPQGAVTLSAGETYELPFPLQKEAGENVDGWLLKDGGGRTVLQVLFSLTPARLLAFREKQALQVQELRMQRLWEEREKIEREREERECETLLDGAVQPVSDAALGDTVQVECCVCLDRKLIRQMALMQPCGHCVVCTTCYTKQVEVDLAGGRRSRCPKCRALVADVMRVFF